MKKLCWTVLALAMLCVSGCSKDWTTEDTLHCIHHVIIVDIASAIADY